MFKRANTLALALALSAIALSVPTTAQESVGQIDFITLSASCDSYSIYFEGFLFGEAPEVETLEYTLEFTPVAGGDVVTVQSSVSVEPDGRSGDFNGNASGTLDLSGTVLVGGHAAIVGGSGKDMAVLEPANGLLECGQGPDLCTGTIGDYVWDDADRDGEQSLGESGISGVEVELLAANGTVAAAATTDAAGTYVFSEICAGEYVVRYSESSIPAGLTATVALAADIALDSNPNGSPVSLATDSAQDLTVDFGFGPCGECDGGVTTLTLEFMGGGASLVEAIENDGDVLFAGLVEPGDAFTVAGIRDDGKIDKELNLYVDGALAVEKMHMSCSKPIGPGLVFGPFAVTAGTSRNGGLICPLVACAATGESDLHVHDDHIRWKIENTGDATITIERITVSWPVVHGNLKEVKFSGDKIYAQIAAPTSVVIESGWKGELKDRQLKAGEDEKLEFKFDTKNATTEADYSILVEFAEGCSLEFVPGANPGGTFECAKPLDELTMIWDGTQTIDVRAWKGTPGSELLADIVDVTVGEKVTVNGYAGSPNDVYWEIFDAAGFKLGDSNFHMSCSDDDMDGPEDCGKREGNGKGNDADMVNDWILEGMVDNQGTMDCTPTP